MQPWESEYEDPRKRVRLAEFIERFGFMAVVCAGIYGNLLLGCVRQRLQRSKNRK